MYTQRYDTRQCMHPKRYDKRYNKKGLTRPARPGPAQPCRKYLAGALHVAERGEADVVEGVVGDVVLAQVGPAVLEGPERQRVELHGKETNWGKK